MYDQNWTTFNDFRITKRQQKHVFFKKKKKGTAKKARCKQKVKPEGNMKLLGKYQSPEVKQALFYTYLKEEQG